MTEGVDTISYNNKLPGEDIASPKHGNLPVDQSAGDLRYRSPVLGDEFDDFGQMKKAENMYWEEQKTKPGMKENV